MDTFGGIVVPKSTRVSEKGAWNQTKGFTTLITISDSFLRAVEPTVMSDSGHPTAQSPITARQSPGAEISAVVKPMGLVAPKPAKTQRKPHKHVFEHTCIALIGHLKPRNVATATIDNAATAVDS